MGEQMTMLKRARCVVRDFVISRRGNVAMMFGIALVPLMIAAGVGLDFARAAIMRSQMNDALDTASLAVGSTPGLDQEKALALAKNFFEANYKGEGKPVVKITTFDTSGKVTVRADSSVTTTLLKIIFPSPIAVNASSTVVWGQTKLWVALVLDNSGSMCQPLGSPCKNTTDTRTKIYQLKTATTSMLGKLQAVSTTPGDVEVAIVPFNRAVDVGTANVGASWIDWTDWDAPPANIASISTSVGPGSNCPFTSGNEGFKCQQNSTNGSSNADKIPSNGMICPSIDSGKFNTDHRDRYYNGCWDSVIKQTQTATKTDTTPITNSQNCSQKGSQTITCTNRSGYPSNGTKTSNTVTVVTSGYTGDSTNTSTNTATNSTTDGTKSCDNKNPKTCTWTRTILQTKTDTTVTKTAYGGYTHTWIVNAHSTWAGCVMDRKKFGTISTVDGYDVRNDSPLTAEAGFPAANLNNWVSVTNCMDGEVSSKLGHVWTDLTAKVASMQANGSTNQAIGVAHGWQMLTQGKPYDTGAAPANTTRYIILLSDGLNTQNRWWGDGSTEGTTEDGYIDDRMDKVCVNAKADGIVIYTLYVHVNGGGNSQPLKDCATDSSKYYDLTTSAQIAVAFADITKQITNVRIDQ